MLQYKINKLKKFLYKALKETTGLADLELTLTKPDGTPIAPIALVTVENDIYEVSYTFDTLGVWRANISSATNGDDKDFAIEITAQDIDSSVDLITTIDGKIDVIDGKVDVVDGKIDSIDTKIDGIDSKISKGGELL